MSLANAVVYSPRLSQTAVQAIQRSGKKRKVFTPKLLGAPGRGMLPALGAVTASKINPMYSKAVIITSDLAQAYTALSYSS